MEIVAVTKQSRSANLLPMSLWQSVGFFGVPWVFFVISIYILLPALDRAGVPLFVSFLISLGGPLGLLIISSCVAYQLEGRSWTWNAFGARFRLGAMRRSSWFWTIGLSLFMLLAPGLLSFSSIWIQKTAPMPIPLFRMFDLQPKAFMGIPLPGGSFWVILFMLF